MPDQTQAYQQPAATQSNYYPNPYQGQTGAVSGYPQQNGYPPQQTPYSAPANAGMQNSPYAALNNNVPQNGPYGTPAGYPAQTTVGRPTATYPAPNQTIRPTAQQRPAYVAQQTPAPAVPAPQDSVPTLSELPSQQTPAAINPIPNDQGQAGGAASDQYVPFNGPCAPSQSVTQSPQSSCSDNSCDDLGGSFNACPWYASLSGLAISRNSPNKVWCTNEPPPFEFRQIMNFDQAQTSWKFGGEIRFGRRFCCETCDPCSAPSGYWAVEANYWTTAAFDGFASITNPNGPTVNTPFVVGNLDFMGVNATTWFNGAAQQAVWRHDEIQSVEISFVRGQWANVYGSNWDFAFNVGPRFFRFEESLMFGSLQATGNPDWSQNGGAAAAYLTDHIINNLWGAQTGFDLGYNFAGGALRMFVVPKVGIYNNNINNTFTAQLGNGAVATINYAGQPGGFPVESSTNALAFMSQIDVGAEWFFAQRWSARVGYRVVAISGIGLADNQFPTYVNAVDEIADIDTNGDLLLHGAFATITFNF
jgi:hypothetical protein